MEMIWVGLRAVNPCTAASLTSVVVFPSLPASPSHDRALAARPTELSTAKRRSSSAVSAFSVPKRPVARRPAQASRNIARQIRIYIGGHQRRENLGRRRGRQHAGRHHRAGHLDGGRHALHLFAEFRHFAREPDRLPGFLFRTVQVGGWFYPAPGP